MKKTTMQQLLLLLMVIVIESLSWIQQAEGGGGIEQIHMAYGGKNPEGHRITISFVTRHAQDGMNDTPMVHFYEEGQESEQGYHRHLLHRTQFGRTTSYVTGMDHHHVIIEGIQTKTVYDYQCEYDGRKSEIKTFEIRAGDEFPLNIAIYGDMGVFNSEETVDRIRGLVDHGRIHQVLHIGDISYADDAFLHYPLKFKYEDVWDEFMNKIEPIASKVPYMTCPGNHEAECHSPACLLSGRLSMTLHNFTAYNTRFHMPSEESRGAMNMWYSYNIGPIHVVMINTETDYPKAPNDHFNLRTNGLGGFGDQLAWLKQDLQQANTHREDRPWIIVCGHRPIYTITRAKRDGTVSGDSKNLQDAFEDLFEAYNVDIYFAGHVHAYERSYPVYNSKDISTSYKKAKHPIHIVTGAGGNVEGHTTGYDFDYRPSWHATANNDEYGFGVLSVVAHEKLLWTFVSSSTGMILDEITIEK